MGLPGDDMQRNALEDALQAFVDAHLAGHRPVLDEFVRQHPGCEDQLRERIQDLLKINTLFDSIVRADESDYATMKITPELAGQKIGSFEIGEVIGRGGMGVVYLAHDTKLDRSVAIKSMPAALVGDSTVRMRFKREAKSLAALSHPNIAVIYDLIEPDEEHGYLVLEYISGATLAERCADGPIALEQALDIGRQLAEAVCAAHEKGIIHRDLKPGNIKITPDGQIKVLDFGLARSSDPMDQNPDITQAGHIVGTPSYMSPEQARAHSTDQRSDIWSFGCIMYEMLTDHRPFAGETATDTLARVIEREPDWELLARNAPANICALLRQCLEKDPKRRLEKIARAGDEISAALDNRTTDSFATAPAKPRHWATLMGTGIIAVLLGIALWFSLTGRPASSRVRLAVLPFENLGPVEDEYFADGITDAITARLAGIRGLGVISRQSAMQYKGAEKGIRQIAKELDVDYLLEGTIQRERPSDQSSRVRITPQLIRASDDLQVWAEAYDNDMKEVIITGGAYTMTSVSVYSEAGWQRDLANMTQGRYIHACSSFTHAGEKVDKNKRPINKPNIKFYRHLST